MNDAAINILPSDQRQFGRYRLLCKLASGGMASLYLARFTSVEGFEKDVAIKRIHDHLTEDAEFVQMFADEARLAAQISHPNVAQILELGSEPGYFIAMEYVDGESLTALVRRAQLPLPVCARIIAQSAAGLHAAHELCGQDGDSLNVVHRDVSPHNILISYGGAVKVVDFGVARARGNLHQTTAGTVKGKFAYMSPEQARMEVVDRRSDIFALGIVLYEISTRYRLFKAPNEAATVTKVLRADIVPPSVLVPNYPPTLERIVLKALSRKREERYDTAEEMQAALEAFVMEQGSPLLSSAIGQIMKMTFPDRIAEKRAVLRSAEAASDLSHEMDLGSSPSLTMGGATVSVAQRELNLRQRRRVFVLGGVGVLLLVVVAGLGALIFDMLAGNHVSRREMVAFPKTVSHPASSASIRVEIHATPPTAQIRVDGKVVTNPYRVEQPARVGQARVTIAADGYLSKSITVSLARGGFFSVALEKSSLEKSSLDKKTAVGISSPAASRPGTTASKLKALRLKKEEKKTVGEKRRQGRGHRVKRSGKNDDLFGNPYAR